MTAASPALERAAADRALMDRVLGEMGAPRVLPDPNLLEYLREVVQRLVARLSRAVGLALDQVALERVAWWLTGITLLAAVGAIAWLLARRWRGKGAAPAPAPLAVSAPRQGDAWDEGRWKTELERHLAEGDARGALSALWWWMARAVAAERAQPAWTSQELLRHAGRGDLLPIAVAVDRLAYGAAVPETADVARVYARLAGALA